MKKYRVEVKWIHRSYVDVEADDRRSAESIVEEHVKNCAIIEPVDQKHTYEITANLHPDEIERRVRETGLLIDPEDRR